MSRVQQILKGIFYTFLTIYRTFCDFKVYLDDFLRIKCKVIETTLYYNLKGILIDI